MAKSDSLSASASSVTSLASKSASSVSSSLSSASASASSVASKSAWSASSLAAKSASSVTSLASKSASSVSSSLSSAAASASASAAGKSPTLATTSTTTLTAGSIALITFTVLIASVIGLHFSGQLDPLYKWAAETFFKAEAKAEIKLLEKTGSKQAEGFLKDRLKKNPIGQELGDGELDEIAQGKGVGDKLGKVNDLGGSVEKKLGSKFGLQ